MTVDYLPIATSGGANVESQASFAGSGHQTQGFSSGIALSSQLNKCWRQASMIAAAIATFISNALGIDVLDDGNLSNLVTNFTNAIKQTAAHMFSVNVTPVSGGASSTAVFNLMSKILSAGKLNAVGKRMVFTIAGVHQFGAAGIATLTVAIGTAAISPIVIQFTSNGGGFFNIEIEIIVLTAGAFGTWLWNTKTAVSDTGGTMISATSWAQSANSGTVDVTAAQTLQVSGQFNVSNAGNLITENSLAIEDWS